MTNDTHRFACLSDFLTNDEILLAIDLQTAEKIQKHIILPNLERINESLGQKNDPRYIAYAVSFALCMAQTKNPLK